MTEQPARRSFRLEEATIDELHAAIRAGKTTCVAVVRQYIERIESTGGMLAAIENGFQNRLRSVDSSSSAPASPRSIRLPLCERRVTVVRSASA